MYTPHSYTHKLYIGTDAPQATYTVPYISKDTCSNLHVLFVALIININDNNYDCESAMMMCGLHKIIIFLY